MAQKPILISGAGPASLLLARSLLLHNIPFEIFERDASFSVRGQGYRLRLSAEGLDAIQSALGPDAWERFYEACGKTAGVGFQSLDALTGELREQRAPVQIASRGGHIVGIARGEMRRQFVQGCEGQIHWSCHVQGYELTSDGVRAVFADGSRSVEGSMLIAGDGIYSKVAQQLSGGRLKVYDTGARGIHGQAPTTAFRSLGEGVFRLVDDTLSEGALSVITNVRSGDMDNPDVQFGWTLTGQPGVVQPPNNDHTIVGKAAADMSKELTARWHPRFQPLFDHMIESEAAFWKITCSSPSGVPEWPNEPRVTLIGDAVHSMTPAGGLGANTAVRDSGLLGQLLSEAGGYKDSITAAYEKEMRVYGSEAVKTSYGLATSQFNVKIVEE